MPEYIPIITPPTPVGEPAMGSTSISWQVTLPQPAGEDGDSVALTPAMLTTADGALYPTAQPPGPTDPQTQSPAPAWISMNTRVSNAPASTTTYTQDLVLLMASVSSTRPALSTVMLEPSAGSATVQQRLTLPFFAEADNGVWTIPAVIHFNAPLSAATDLLIEVRVVALSSLLTLVNETGQGVYLETDTLNLAAGAGSATTEIVIDSSDLAVPSGTSGIAALVVATLLGANNTRLRAASAATTLITSW
ncbi:MAG: hypothetical protein IT204_06370 [Fimbriimonadaceae bacterium]|nr:hypothetical protein [Fimbriimonadaceae bacterium]